FKQQSHYMAKYFSKQGVRAIAVYSDSQIRRNDALKQLNEGSIDILFSVDLFNEGTDLPAIDTILMIRPTESKILFLQQLGRG
ncbi:DEAD/DEAH box helicase, partial [Vibrio anguillarum]